MTVHQLPDRELAVEPVSPTIRNAVHFFERSVVLGLLPPARTAMAGILGLGAVSTATPALSVISGAPMVVFETTSSVEERLPGASPATALASIRRHIEVGQLPSMAPNVVAAAESALLRIEARDGEDVEEWAKRLADGLSRPND